MEIIMIFDSHAHYNDRQFDEDRDILISQMPQNNVGYIMNACSELSEMKDITELVNKFPFVYGSVGIHPGCAVRPDAETEKLIRQYAAMTKINAIGEIGLDYYYDDVPRDIQKECFDFQIKLAMEMDMPIIVHDREAHGDSMDMMRANKGVKGVFHCYSGSKEMAKELVDMGLYIAFGGSLTFKNNVKTVEAAKFVPLENILVETDCPYLAPVPNRGKRNSSLNVHYVIEKIAEIKGIDAKLVEEQTCLNAKKLFNIGD